MQFIEAVQVLEMFIVAISSPSVSSSEGAAAASSRSWGFGYNSIKRYGVGLTAIIKTSISLWVSFNLILVGLDPV